jgi:hypothetical protein
MSLQVALTDDFGMCDGGDLIGKKWPGIICSRLPISD